MTHSFALLAGSVTAVAAAGLLIRAFVRGAALRHNVLLAALLAVLASPLFVATVRTSNLSIALPLLPAAAPHVEVPVRTPAAVAPIQEVALPSVAEPATQAPSTATPRVAAIEPATREAPAVSEVAFVRSENVWLWLWGLGTLAGLMGMGRAAVNTLRLLRSVRPFDDATHGDALEQARMKLGVRRFPRVGTTGRVSGPVVTGAVGRPWILIPLRFLETLSAVELVQVLVHEGAHVIRRDPLIVLLQRVAGSVFWWHPLIHLLNRQLSRAREEVCDNFVLRHVEPDAYGATLLRLATLSPRLARPSMAVGLLDGSWKLEDRIRGLIDPDRRPTTRVGVATAVLVLAAFLLLPALVCVTRIVAAQPQPPAGVAQPPAVPPAVPDPEAAETQLRVELSYEGESDKPFYHLILQEKPTADPVAAFRLVESIDAEQSAKLVEYLKTTGFFQRAQPKAPKGTGPRYILKVQRDQGGVVEDRYEDLGWELGMLRRLDRIRKVLDGKPVEGMDRLLGRLAGLRVAWLADLEQAKQDYRNQRGERRIAAAKRIYSQLQIGMTRPDVIGFFGSPDGAKAGQLNRFFSYVVEEGKTIEIEFDPATQLVVRTRETGLGLDPPPPPVPAIPESQKPYLEDYVAGKTTLRAGFVPGKAELVWGEPLEVTFRVDNIGQADFQFEFGGDYRGSGRHDRFKIEVVDETGKLLPDPKANAPDFGGIVGFEIVTPGGPIFQRTVNLADFRTISKPGRYTVTCTFAFDEGPRNDAPAKPVVRSQFPLTILERTPERVARVLDGLVAQAKTADDAQRDAAMDRIARFGQKDAVPRLKQLAGQGPLALRTAALAALPAVGVSEAEDVALAGLQDPEPVVRSAAARAVGQFKTERGIDALLNAFHREKSPVNAAVLVALGTTGSPRALPEIVTSLEQGTPELKSAGLEALAVYGGEPAIAELRKHVTSSDLLFRYTALKVWERFRLPMEPEWLLPILMSQTRHHPGWYDVRRMIRLYCGDKAVPTLLSGVDFDVAWSYRNWWILEEVKACSGAPTFEYEHDPNSDGTPEQWEKNKETLQKLKPLAGPIPKAPRPPPREPIPVLKTEPPIDFTPVLTSLPKAVRLRSGFYETEFNRNGGRYSYEPSPEHARPYNRLAVIRDLLKDPAKLAAAGITAEQAERLRALPRPDNVQSDGLVTQLYIAWRDSPPGPIQDRAADELRDSAQRTSQNHHAAVIAFVDAAERILNEPEQGVRNQQQRAQPPAEGVAEIHPKMQDSPLWRDLQARLAKGTVPYRLVQMDEQGHVRLSLGETATTDISYLKGAVLESLDLSNTAVRDLSPLAGMSSLRHLDLSGSQVEDFSPLKGLKLTRLSLTGTRVRDLSPLVEARLTELVANGTPIVDLSPLAAMPLAYLDLRRTHVASVEPLAKLPLATLQLDECPVKDLAPLRGLPLQTLSLRGFRDQDLADLQGLSARWLVLGGAEITDLAPLKGLRLETLTLDAADVKDLTPLKGMPLTGLDLRQSPVTDLMPLQGMKLTALHVSEPGVDLAPLRGMPLETISLPDVSTVKNLDVLRGMSTLKWIRPPECKPIPAAAFWRAYDAGERFPRR